MNPSPFKSPLYAMAILEFSGMTKKSTIVKPDIYVGYVPFNLPLE
jgi:hypothetical protein